MTSLNNNNIREDAIFKGKVKDILLRNNGGGGLVNVLLDFNARDAAAVQAQNSSADNSSKAATSTATGSIPANTTVTKATTSSSSVKSSTASNGGLTYADFIAFLSDHGVELTSFEQQYLCRAFDDAGSGRISASTFTRHLTGLNERRLRAVNKAWTVLEEKKTDGNADSTEVTRDTLLSSYQAANAQQQQQSNTLANTFSDSRRQQLKESYLASTNGRTAAASNATASSSSDDVSYAEFVAFYAGISSQFGTDEDFVAHVLKSWAADDTARPTLNETNRKWGPDGDPLAMEGTHYVQDALNHELGLSSKAYNFSHMQREHPYVEPLPPLNRPDIMATTTQKTYVRYDGAERTLANPLVTRRGQEM